MEYQCKNCTYWDGTVPTNVPPEEAEEGHCALASPGHYDSMRTPENTLAYASGHTGWEFLITKPNFGCVQFERRA